MITNTKLTKTPWIKSVMITAICPPAKTKNREIVNNRIINNANVDISMPKTGTLSGKPQK